MAGLVSDAVRVSVRGADGEVAENLDWDTVAIEALQAAAPWRTFRWYDGQRHYCGTYWSATVRDHVIYESRLELTRLLFADFDPAVTDIVAQPFLLLADVDGAPRKHVPDYLLLTQSGPVVVDVKPRERLGRTDVAFTFGWTRHAVQRRGWRYEVWSEPPSAVLENIRFLAGYRRAWLFDEGLLHELRAVDLDGVTLGEAFTCLSDRPAVLLRAGVLRLLWARELVTDLARPLGSNHVIRRAM